MATATQYSCDTRGCAQGAGLRMLGARLLCAQQHPFLRQLGSQRVSTAHVARRQDPGRTRVEVLSRHHLRPAARRGWAGLSRCRKGQRRRLRRPMAPPRQRRPPKMRRSRCSAGLPAWLPPPPTAAAATLRNPPQRPPLHHLAPRTCSAINRLSSHCQAFYHNAIPAASKHPATQIDGKI